MKTLFLDTATNYLVVGLLNDNMESLVTRIGKNDNSAYIINKIDELLKLNNITIDEIDEIIVGVGPGSYTGVRVSVVAAKTLSYTKNIPLRKISSLQFLSSGYSNVTAAIDARRNYAFAGEFKNGEIIKPDHYISLDKIGSKDNYILLNENTIKINLVNIKKYSELVENVHNLEPNYMRKTEAENNHDQINDNWWYWSSC